MYVSIYSHKKGKVCVRLSLRRVSARISTWICHVRTYMLTYVRAYARRTSRWYIPGLMVLVVQVVAWVSSLDAAVVAIGSSVYSWRLNFCCFEFSYLPLSRIKLRRPRDVQNSQLEMDAFGKTLRT